MSDETGLPQTGGQQPSAPLGYPPAPRSEMGLPPSAFIDELSTSYPTIPDPPEFDLPQTGNQQPGLVPTVYQPVLHPGTGILHMDIQHLGFPPIPHPATAHQPGIPPVPFMGHPPAAPSQATMAPGGVPNAPSATEIINIHLQSISHRMGLDPQMLYVPRTPKMAVQLSLAIHLHIETPPPFPSADHPGIPFDDHTIASIVFNRPYGERWEPPADFLVSNMDRNHNETRRQWYQEVIFDRHKWKMIASCVCAAWQALSKQRGPGGVVPPLAYLGRW